MAFFTSFGIIVPTRNAPASRCVEIAQRMHFQSTKNEFRFPLKIIFLVNDSEPEFSAQLPEALAAAAMKGIEIDVLYSDQDYATVEENLKNNLARHADRLPDAFLIIGNSDVVDFGALQGALDFIEQNHCDLLLVAVQNCEFWDGKIIRAVHSTPDVGVFEKTNRLSRQNVCGPDVFADVLHDYGPVDYLAYIGCQIYTKKLFLDLCRVQIREPLYSLPVGTLELASRGMYQIGFYHSLVTYRIDVLNFGPDNPAQPSNWWVSLSRVKRGLSKECALSVVSSSLDLGDKAFETLIKCNLMSVVRAEGRYIHRPYLSSLLHLLYDTFMRTREDRDYRLAHSEILDVMAFGERLEKIDLGIGAAAQTLVCEWLKNIAVTEGRLGLEPLQMWVNQYALVHRATVGKLRDATGTVEIAS
jgi:hypothetical protein